MRVDYVHKEIYYSEEQYKKHFSELKRLNKLYEGFSFYVLDNLSFSNIKIVITKHSVIVSRLISPEVSFCSSNPFLRKAFCDYAKFLGEKKK